MRPVIFVAIALGLVACGVDGEPVPPEPSKTEPGITLTGRAEIGVAYR